jgi:tetratricopeptide (TPR) repeat protein
MGDSNNRLRDPAIGHGSSNGVGDTISNGKKPSRRSWSPQKCLKKIKSFFRSVGSLFVRHKILASVFSVIIIAIIAILILVTVNSRNGSVVIEKTNYSKVSSQYKSQLPSLKRAVDNKPNDSTTHKNYAVALYATGNLTKATEQYEDAIKINAKDATAYNNLANAYRDLKEYDKAVADYNMSISLNSSAINPYVNLANVQLYDLSKPADAIATYKKALIALPNNTQIELLLGIAYEQAGDKTNAKQTYQNILSQDSGNVAAKERLAALK